MGNCLKRSNSDDISLIRGRDSLNEFAPTQNEEFITPFYYASPSFARQQNPVLSEEGQVKIAKRMGLINHLPIGTYDGSSKTTRECVICMIEFCVNETVRYLPCMHIYHDRCIDDWLMRNLTCPSCMEPVDAALLTNFETT